MYKNIFYACCIAVIAMSCGNGSNTKITDFEIPEAAPSTTHSETNKNKDGVAGIEVPGKPSAASDSTLNSGGPVNPDWEKKIIKTAQVLLQLKDYNAYNSSLHNRLKNYGAYVAQEKQTESEDQITNEITIKVPVDKFEELMNTLPGADIKILEKNITTQDVTDEVVDVKLRIEAKKEIRKRYLDLLKQAKNMKEILEVQNEINDIQIDIEVGTGRANYLAHSSSYSTINLRYFQLLKNINSENIQPGFLKDVMDAFKTGGSIIIQLILFFITIWPLIFIAIFVTIYVRRLQVKNTSIQCSAQMHK